METPMTDETIQSCSPPPGTWRSRPPEERFGAWYAERWEPSRRLAARLAGNPEDGADIAASVLVDVWARWQLAGVPESPDAYLNRAIRNRSASHFQRRDRDRAATHRLRTEQPRSYAGPEASVVDRDAVDGVLARLPADERRTVTLLYLADLSASETARELGIRPATVRSRVHRSRRRLASTAA
jgi:RNA polymerase sigma-70 factor, ECF subfamily